MMMDRVVRFFITLFLAIAGGALLHLATPLLTELISTEIFKVDMGLFKITATSLLCIILGAVLGGIIGFIISPYLINKLTRNSRSGWRRRSRACPCMMSWREPSAS